MQDVLDAISQTIFDKKGVNILALDIREISTMSDYFVIAEGLVERHVQALAQELKETLKKHNVTPLHVEGETLGDWVVIDCGWVIIHLFTHDMREKYDLESLWREAKIVNVKIMIDQSRKGTL